MHARPTERESWAVPNQLEPNIPAGPAAGACTKSFGISPVPDRKSPQAQALTPRADSREVRCRRISSAAASRLTGNQFSPPPPWFQGCTPSSFSCQPGPITRPLSSIPGPRLYAWNQPSRTCWQARLFRADGPGEPETEHPWFSARLPLPSTGSKTNRHTSHQYTRRLTDEASEAERPRSALTVCHAVVPLPREGGGSSMRAIHTTHIDYLQCAAQHHPVGYTPHSCLSATVSVPSCRKPKRLFNGRTRQLESAPSLPPLLITGRPGPLEGGGRVLPMIRMSCLSGRPDLFWPVQLGLLVSWGGHFYA